jgi:4-amino-4-deoxy-L-arabinose transferase-like glycosyltransferase
MKQIMLHLLVLIAVASAIFLTNLGEARLWDRDEPRNAGCAAEMMARGDWVVPTFNDELRHQKPVLLYWLMMMAYSVLGQSEFSARICSALLGVGTVLATYGIARRLANPKIALLAGVILASNLMFTVAARAATPDSVLIFCSTLALLIYVVGTFKPRTLKTIDARSELVIAPLEQNDAELRSPGNWFPQNYFCVAALYVVLGLGVLAKGPVGFLLPMAMMGLFMLIQRLPSIQLRPAPISASIWGRASQGTLNMLGAVGSTFHPVHFSKTLWSMRPISAAIIVLLVAAPWYLMVDTRTNGDFTQLFFLGEHFGRATTAMENHGGGVWFYPLAILVGFFPWSVFWGPVVVWTLAQRKSRGRFTTVEVFAMSWIVVQVGAFSIAQTKLPSYVTPCYPALAILTSGCLIGWIQRQSHPLTSSANNLPSAADSNQQVTPNISLHWFVAAMAALIFGGLVTAAGLGYAANIYFPTQIWMIGIGLIPILGGAVAFWQLIRTNHQHALWTTVTTSVLFIFLFFGFGTVAVDTAQQSQLVLRQVVAAESDQVVASYRALESSWVFYGQKPIYECSMATRDAESESLDRRNWWEAKPRISAEMLATLHPNAMFITTDEHLAELQQKLPPGFEVVERANYFLKEQEILLLRRPSKRVARMNQPAQVR